MNAATRLTKDRTIADVANSPACGLSIGQCGRPPGYDLNHIRRNKQLIALMGGPQLRQLIGKLFARIDELEGR